MAKNRRVSSKVVSSPVGPGANSPVVNTAADAWDGRIVPVDAILCTEELQRRPSRPPDY